MKERPILFSAPMVRAILDGRKTQTRRVLKQATGPSLSVGCEDSVAELSWLHGDGPGYDVRETIERVPCPFGAPGDRLYVRETWGYRGSSWSSERPDVEEQHIHYRADDSRRSFTRARDDESGLPKQREPRPDEDYYHDYYNGYLERYWKAWRPSIHMPRWACRLELEVTEVRVERLQSIRAEDVMAEGVTVPRCGCEVCATGTAICPADASELLLEWQALWVSINGQASWDANPWVWVVGFRRIER